MFPFNLSSVKYESTALYCYLYRSETAQAIGKLGFKVTGFDWMFPSVSFGRL